MNQQEIDAFLKQSNENRRRKEEFEELMKKHCKDSDFNQDLKSVAFMAKEQGIMWYHSEKHCECSVCGISAADYRLLNGKKIFACKDCSFHIKK